MHPRNEFSSQRIHQIQLGSSLVTCRRYHSRIVLTTMIPPSQDVHSMVVGSHHDGGWWEVFSILRFPFINILRLTRSCHGISFLVIVLRCATFLFLLQILSISPASFLAVCMSFSIHSQCNFPSISVPYASFVALSCFVAVSGSPCSCS